MANLRRNPRWAEWWGAVDAAAATAPKLQRKVRPMPTKAPLKLADEALGPHGSICASRGAAGLIQDCICWQSGVRIAVAEALDARGDAEWNGALEAVKAETVVSLKSGEEFDKLWERICNLQRPAEPQGEEKGEE